MPRDSAGHLDLARLQEVVLSDPSGERHRLGDYWVAQPVVLVFARHFG